MSKDEKPAIEVKGLSKSYTINHKNKASYSTIKDDFGKLFTHPFRKDATVDSEETFWALDDISFNINKGEIFGIIGRNGSGKSTLLKILSRIVEPTKGEAILRGRVASLLEVGTGFNPELTGRENIFFNGSMLGMSKREIATKYNEIVEFSGVEKFIDTPVKFYSSGMYVRLAFSVAAHLEPDVLILDEVLAVGDDSFQEKSRKKILSTMEKGSTVIFVSHSAEALRQLCSRGLLLEKGKPVFVGDIDDVLEKYTGKRPGDSGDNLVVENRGGLHDIMIKKLSIKSLEGNKLLGYSEPVSVRIGLNKKIWPNDISIDLNFINANGDWVCCVNNEVADKPLTQTDSIVLNIKKLLLAPGEYTVNISLHADGKLQDYYPDITKIRVKTSSEISPSVSGVTRLVGEITQ